MEEKKFLKLNDIEVYKTSFNLSNTVYCIVKKWDSFPKDTVGKQFVRSVDSISANIAEDLEGILRKIKLSFTVIVMDQCRKHWTGMKKLKKESL
jgi:four helix bundle protein